MSGAACARHCRLLFMKHVLPRLARPAAPRGLPGDCRHTTRCVLSADGILLTQKQRLAC